MRRRDVEGEGCARQIKVWPAWVPSEGGLVLSEALLLAD